MSRHSSVMSDRVSKYWGELGRPTVGHLKQTSKSGDLLILSIVLLVFSSFPF